MRKNALIGKQLLKWISEGSCQMQCALFPMRNMFLPIDHWDSRKMKNVLPSSKANTPVCPWSRCILSSSFPRTALTWEFALKLSAESGKHTELGPNPSDIDLVSLTGPWNLYFQKFYSPRTICQKPSACAFLAWTDKRSCSSEVLCFLSCFNLMEWLRESLYGR